MPLVGNVDLETRKAFMESIKEHNGLFRGVVFEGVEMNKSTHAISDPDSFKSLAETMHTLADETVLRVFPVSGRPDTVCEAVEQGFDLFSGSYPFAVTNNSQALSFEYSLEKAQEQNDQDNDQDDEDYQVARKKKKTRVDLEVLLNIKDKKYAEDFGPLVEACVCFTCKHHTRAYICHLLNTSEISGHTLLMMHNMACYYGFFHQLRLAIERDQFKKFKSFILKQFKSIN
jgi:queuine tRNA-ribosyltransferase subunit QTRTD1